MKTSTVKKLNLNGGQQVRIMKLLFSVLFEFEYQTLERSQIINIDDKSIPTLNILYITFKKRLERYYGRKKVNQIVVYHDFYHEDSFREELWYEPNSQLCMFFTYDL